MKIVNSITAIFAAALAMAMVACTSSDEGAAAAVEVNAGIGNDCGPADAREVWLRVADPGPGDTLPIHSCPAYTDGGIRIRVLEGIGLDGLKKGTYADLPARDCRGAATGCPALTATVKVEVVGDTEVRGTYRLADSTGANPGETLPFRAARCVLTPLCG